MKQLHVMRDAEANECLYIDGRRWDGYHEVTVYSCDLVSAAEGKPVLLSDVSIDDEVDEWPELLQDACKLALPGLAKQFRSAAEERRKVITKEMCAVTRYLDAHPAGWEFPCECHDCRGYGDPA